MSTWTNDFPNLAVIKVGGSLLSWPDLPTALNQFLDQFSTPVVLIPGGGETANLVRGWQPHFQLDQSTAHFLAIDSLSLNSRLLSNLIPNATVINDLHDVQPCLIRGMHIVPDLARWVEKYEDDQRLPLPHTWNVTSDSLALWVCGLLNAKTCYFLKSVDLPVEVSIQEAAQLNLLDQHSTVLWTQLPDIVSKLSLFWINFRKKDAQQQLAWSF